MPDDQDGQTVCVIEDDDATREIVCLLLEDEGYRVLSAANGVLGLALLQASSERLVVVLDHKLPEMDGCDLLELAANDSALRERHVFILMTASPQRAEADCGESLEELGAPVVPKPFNLDTLTEAVAEAAQRILVA